MSTYTVSLGLEKITPGSQAGLWGNTTNNTYDLIDQAITGITPLVFSASGETKTLTDDNGASNQARSAVLNITGSATGSNTVIVPNKQKTYLVRNNTGQDVVFSTASPSATYAVGAGYSILIFCDGNNNVFTGIASPGVGTLSVNAGGTGATTFTAGFIKSTGGTNALVSTSGVNASSEITGTLPVANGGTGVTSFTSGAVLLGNGSGAVSTVTASTTGYVLTWNGSSWQPQAPSAGITTITAGSGINVSGSTNVTITNAGVTSISAGSGISVSGSGGSYTISATGSSGVTTVFGRSGPAITAQSTDYSSYYGSLTGTNSWSGTNYFNGLIQSVAFNMQSTTSIFCTGTGSPVQIAVNGVYPFYFYSSGTANATNWNSVSDSRIKENVEKVIGGLDTVAKLNPVRFSFKKDELAAPNHYGMLAQELEEVIPDVVFTTEQKDGDVENIKTVNYSAIIPILVKAIQELKAEVDALKAVK